MCCWEIKGAPSKPLYMGLNLFYLFNYLLLPYSSKRGKSGTKRLVLHKGTSQKTYIQLHSQMLPKLQNKTKQNKKKNRTFYKNTENNKYSHTHTKNKLAT